MNDSHMHIELDTYVDDKDSCDSYERHMFQLFIIDAHTYDNFNTETGAVTKCDQCGVKSNKVTIFGCVGCLYNIYNFHNNIVNTINRGMLRPIDIVIRPKNELLAYNELDAAVFFSCGLTEEQFRNLRFVAKGVLINKQEVATNSVDILCGAMLGASITPNSALLEVAPTPDYVSFVYITNRGCVITITTVFDDNTCAGTSRGAYLSLEPRVSNCPACSLQHSLMCYNCILAATGRNSGQLLSESIDILNACLFKYNCEFISNDIIEISRYIWNNSQRCLYNTRANPALVTIDVLREVIAFDRSDIQSIQPELENMYETYAIVHATLFG